MAAKWFIQYRSSAHAHPPSDGQKKSGAYLDRSGVKSVMVGSKGGNAKDAPGSQDMLHNTGLCVSSTRETTTIQGSWSVLR